MLMDTSLGLGAPLPKDASESSRQLSSHVILRKKLLGRNAQKPKTTAHGVKSTKNTVPPQRQVKTRVEVEDEDDDEGRSSLGKSKRRKLERMRKETNQDDADEQAQEGPDTRVGKSSTSYLDEMLSERSRKRKKKKRARDKEAR